MSNSGYGVFAGLPGPGGAEGNRTPDLVIANDALYQLSYSPDPWFWPAQRAASRIRCFKSSIGQIPGRLVVAPGENRARE